MKMKPVNVAARVTSFHSMGWSGICLYMMAKSSVASPKERIMWVVWMRIGIVFEASGLRRLVM